MPDEVVVHAHTDVRLVDGVESYLHHDQLGSVVLITDATGAKAVETMYRPFGEQAFVQTVDPAMPEEARGFIGERYDADAGLQFLNARYYDPELGLFLQPDWFEVTQAGVGTNRYAYSGNDPVNLRDPEGNCYKWCSLDDDGSEPTQQELQAVGELAASILNPLPDFGELTDDDISAADAFEVAGVFPVGRVAGMMIDAVRPAARATDTGLDGLLRRDGGVYDGPGGPRLPQDELVNPNAPGRMGTNRPIGQSATQNAEAQRTVQELRDMGAEDIRVNQQQVNAAGQRVGTCRPDIQCTLNRQRVYIELDRSPASRAIPHAQRLRSNDPNGIIWLRTIN